MKVFWTSGVPIKLDGLPVSIGMIAVVICLNSLTLYIKTMTISKIHCYIRTQK